MLRPLDISESVTISPCNCCELLTMILIHLFPVLQAHSPYSPFFLLLDMITLNRSNVEDLMRQSCKTRPTSSAIMESLDSLPTSDRDDQKSTRGSMPWPDLMLPAKSGLQSLSDLQSFLLIDGREHLKVSSAEHFVKNLNCAAKDLKIKVVSIFGNTGDGKSHTLNQTFFNGQEVFRTSNEQSSCTLGVWAAFDPALKVICLDTEGLLGRIQIWKCNRIFLNRINFVLARSSPTTTNVLIKISYWF